MGTIIKDVYAPAVADFASMAECSKRLMYWHSSLPESLRLSRAVSGNDSKQRSAVLLTHCSYLNCVILMCRKTLLGLCTGAPPSASNGNGDGNANNGLADEYAQMCVSAGRQLATVLIPVSVLRSEGHLCLLTLYIGGRHTVLRGPPRSEMLASHVGAPGLVSR